MPTFKEKCVDCGKESSTCVRIYDLPPRCSTCYNKKLRNKNNKRGPYKLKKGERAYNKAKLEGEIQ